VEKNIVKDSKKQKVLLQIIIVVKMLSYLEKINNIIFIKIFYSYLLINMETNEVKAT
jgi:hypothetical protein